MCVCVCPLEPLAQDSPQSRIETVETLEARFLWVGRLPVAPGVANKLQEVYIVSTFQSTCKGQTFEIICLVFMILL